MIKIFKIIFVSLLLICSNESWCQLNMVGASFTTGSIQDKEFNLNQPFIGITGSIEAPIKEFSARLEFSYLSPQDNQNTVSLDKLSYWKVSMGYILRKQRLQIPLFVGAGKYDSEGSIQLDDWSVGARSGIRFYVTERIALFGEASYQHLLAGETKINDGVAPPVTASLSPNSLQLHVGVLFSYIKK